MLCLILRPDWACFGPFHFVGIEPPTLLHGDFGPHSVGPPGLLLVDPRPCFGHVLDPGMLCLILRPDRICFGPFQFVGIEPPTLLHGDSSPHSDGARGPHLSSLNPPFGFLSFFLSF